MTRAIIYTRTSTGDQTLGHDAQEAECRAHAARLGAEVVEVFSDTISGSTPPSERDGFIAAVNSLAKGDILLMWRRDRLGRSLVNNAVGEKLIATKGARLVTSDVSSDDSAETAMLKAMLDAIAEYERAVIIARTKAALAAKRARGERLGNLPLGYTEDTEGCLMFNADEQQKIDRVRAKRAEGISIDDLVIWCEEAGITSRTGSTPSRATIAVWVKGVEMEKKVLRKTPPPSPGRPTIESSRAGLKELCLALHAQGGTFREIAEKVAAAGIRNSKGNPFTHICIYRIIKRAA
jgi:DNA invertase Pin-like site-specific DNA recombinase